MEEKFEQAKSGSELIKKMVKTIKTPVDKEAVKALNDSVKLLNKKIKMMEKDENLAIQYADKVAFDTIQGVFQAFHLWIISTNGDEMVEDVMEWLRTHENTYSIAQRLQAKALARAEFSGAK